MKYMDRIQPHVYMNGNRTGVLLQAKTNNPHWRYSIPQYDGFVYALVPTHYDGGGQVQFQPRDLKSLGNRGYEVWIGNVDMVQRHGVAFMTKDGNVAQSFGDNYFPEGTI